MAGQTPWWIGRWLECRAISVDLSIYVSICLSFCLSIYLSIYRLSVYLSIDLSICFSIYLSHYLSMCLSLYLSVYLQAWKRSYSARLDRNLKDESWKTKLFCKTSFNLEVDNIKNAALLRDLLQKSKLSTSKTKQFCETSFKNGKLSAELTALCQCVLRFSHPTSLKYCAPAKKWGQVTGSAAPVTQNHLSKPEDLMLQNAAPCRKSASWPPNISDGNISSITPARRPRRHVSFQILFKRPTHFENCHKTFTFYSLLARCRVPCACHAKPHPNFKK